MNLNQGRTQMTGHKTSLSCCLKTALFVFTIHFFTLLPSYLCGWEKIDFKNTPTPAMFPESDAVVIKNEGQMEIRRNGEALFTEHKIIKIFSDTGQRYGRQSLPFNNSVEIVSIKARTINEGGKKFILDENQITEKSMFSEYALYSDAKVKEFNFPRVEKNCIVEYEYKFLLKSLKIPKDLGFKFKVVNDNIEPQIKPDDDGKKLVFTWEAKDKKALKKETFMPPLSDVTSGLAFSPSAFKMDGKIYPSKTWDDVARWYRELSSESVVGGEDVKDLASALISNSESKEKKVKAIYQWVQDNLRYVLVAIGTSAFKPHNCQSVLEYKYGDCKDMSSFLIALLKAIGINAFPTLISTKGHPMALTDMPKPRQFDHVMVVVPLDGEYLWLDPACRNCKFGELPFEDQGATALIVKNDGGELITSPESSFGQNLSQTSWEIKLYPDQSTTGKVIIKAEGQEDLAFRNSLSELKPTRRKKALLDFVSFWFVNVDQDRYEFKNLEEKDSSVCIVGEFAAEELGIETGGKLFLPVNFTIQRNISQTFPKKERDFPVLFDYKFSNTDEATIEIPEQFEIEFLPPNISLDETFGSFESSYEIVDDKIYHKSVFERKELFIPVEKYGQLKDFYDKVAREDNQKIILKRKFQAR
ncbi:MAG: hypothetical protein AMJ73_06700 [candidate division Zixibacteria bacterium SM1_73]|nr:MAG: hypothetical protein AMJ73_06700 [candidate division Zixibacteria bacterium SM1_73]